MTSICEEKVYILWPLDRVEKRDIFGAKQVNRSRKLQLMRINEVLESVDPRRMKNNGMTTVEEAKQTVSVNNDSGTKEEENAKEDKVLEDKDTTTTAEKVENVLSIIDNN